MAKTSQADFEAALARAHADGKASATAEAQTAIAAAYVNGRADAAAILEHDNATGRMALAVALAGDAGVTPLRAHDLMRVAPKTDEPVRSLKDRIAS